MIPVTKPYLPDRDKLDKYIDGIYQREWLTNNGPLVQELTQRLETYLGVENLLLVGNGTLALQVAYRALGISGSDSRDRLEGITTPFSFVATASSLKWEGVEPKFVDIDRESWCLDPKKIKNAITERTKVIVPVHVFGNACDVDNIKEVAEEYRLPVIYDAAHAFGVKCRGESILRYGDAATLSFHATKLFHSIEGGAVIFSRKSDYDRASKIINFGITGPDSIGEVGINAKMNEFQAAMGLCVLDEIDKNISERERVWKAYESDLAEYFEMQSRERGTNNYSYFPLLMRSEENVLSAKELLSQHDISARRYFYPSLDSISYTGCEKFMHHSRDIASRVLCLPVYSGLTDQDVTKVSTLLKRYV